MLEKYPWDFLREKMTYYEMELMPRVQILDEVD